MQHATGTGGRTMESLIDQGYFQGVLDVTTTEWADELVGGTLSAGPTRLDAAGVQLICLAGFMRLLTPTFVNRWDGRAINIHPSLLPAFPGLDTHARAIDAGARFAGCTVHFLSAEMDAGPIIAQAAMPIHADDTPDSLAARVLEAEHEIYRRAIRWIADGRVSIEAGRVMIDNVGPDASFYLPMAH